MQTLAGPEKSCTQMDQKLETACRETVIDSGLLVNLKKIKFYADFLNELLAIKS